MDQNWEAPKSWDGESQATPEQLIEAGKSYLTYVKGWAVANSAVIFEAMDNPEAMEALAVAEKGLQDHPISEAEEHFMDGILLLTRVTPDTAPFAVAMVLDGLELTAATLADLYSVEHIIKTIRAVEAATA